MYGCPSFFLLLYKYILSFELYSIFCVTRLLHFLCKLSYYMIYMYIMRENYLKASFIHMTFNPSKMGLITHCNLAALTIDHMQCAFITLLFFLESIPTNYSRCE